MRNVKHRNVVGRVVCAVVESMERRTLMSASPIALDPTFGSGGVAIAVPGSDYGEPVFITADRVAELPNGQTLSAGEVSVGGETGVYIRRFNKNGSVDDSFAEGQGYSGQSGYVFFGPVLGPVGPFTSDAVGLAVDVAGNIDLGELGIGITRFSSNGQLDKTFGTNGTASVNETGKFLLESDGRILVSSGTSTLTALTPNGMTDDTFGNAGTVTLPAAFTEEAGALAAQSDGAILVGGSTQLLPEDDDLAVVRLNSSGAIDTGFGNAGMAVANGLPSEHVVNGFRYEYSAGPTALAVLPDGTIVVAGDDGVSGGADSQYVGPTIAEFLPSGKLNPSFGIAGQTSTYDAVSQMYTEVSGLIVQADGSLILTGSQDVGFPPVAYDNAFVMRYAADGTVNSFVTSQFVPVDGAAFANVVNDAVAGPDGTVVVAGYVDYQTYAVLARYITDAATSNQLLSGSVIGSTGSYGGKGNVAANAFDGNINTFFDAKQASGDWTGLDLGSARTITQIAYTPRAGWADRMVGGVFQGSNTANFTSGVQTLYTISDTPTEGQLTTVDLTGNGSYRYVRYLGPTGSYCNIAEAQFFAAPAKLTGAVIGTAGSYNNAGNTIANAFDGNLSTFFDAPTPSGAWVGLDLGTATAVSQVSFAPRDSGYSGFAQRMVGGEIQASNTADFSSGVVTAYTITAAPPVEQLTTVTLPAIGAYRYWRYIGPAGGSCNIAELEFDG